MIKIFNKLDFIVENQKVLKIKMEIHIGKLCKIW